MLCLLGHPCYSCERKSPQAWFILEIDIICLCAAVIFDQGECAELLSQVFMREKLHGHVIFGQDVTERTRAADGP